MKMTLGALLALSLHFVAVFGWSEGVPELPQRNSLPGFQRTLRSVAQKVLPVVVQINVVEIIRQPAPEGVDKDDFFKIIPGGGEKSAKEYRRPGIGSGIVVHSRGSRYYVVTNNHVIGRGEEITLLLHNGKEYPAVLIGRDERKDLAVLSFSSSENIPIAEIGNSSEVRVGDWAIAAGSPLGFESSLTIGIISALGRRGGPGSNISDFIQTDAVINPGNSGGALVNMQGQVIGINTWIASTTGNYMGFGFSIPIDNVKRSINELIEKGAVDHGWLGVELFNPLPTTREFLRITHLPGSLVMNLYQGSPADSAGIKLGDYITHINGRQVADTPHLIQMIADLKPESTVDITLVRNGELMCLPVKLEKRAQEKFLLHENGKLWPGFFVVFTEKNETEAEAQVVLVFRDTPASLAGFARGDIIKTIDGQSLGSVHHFFGLINGKKPISFVVQRGEREIRLRLEKE